MKLDYVLICSFRSSLPSSASSAWAALATYTAPALATPATALGSAIPAMVLDSAIPPMDLVSTIPPTHRQSSRRPSWPRLTPLHTPMLLWLRATHQRFPTPISTVCMLLLLLSPMLPRLTLATHPMWHLCPMEVMEGMEGTVANWDGNDVARELGIYLKEESFWIYSSLYYCDFCSMKNCIVFICK